MNLKKLFNKLREFRAKRNSNSLVKYLKDNGIEFGEGTYFQNPKYTEIDLSRPSLIKIDKNCSLINIQS